MKTILVIRHGHREESNQGSFGNDIPLNREGRDASLSLGKLMRGLPIRELHTSPILRCVQTAEELLKGANQKVDVFMSKLLGDPGVFIEDPEKAGALFLQKPLKEIAQTIVNEEKLVGLRSLHEGGHIFLNYISQVKQFPCLMISHDIIICLLCCFLLRSKNVGKYMPNFLEGFAITINPESLSIHWQDQEQRFKNINVRILIYKAGLDLDLDK